MDMVGSPFFFIIFRVMVSIRAAVGYPAATDVRTKEGCNDIISIRTVHRMTNGDFADMFHAFHANSISIRADG